MILSFFSLVTLLGSFPPALPGGISVSNNSNFLEFISYNKYSIRERLESFQSALDGEEIVRGIRMIKNLA